MVFLIKSLIKRKRLLLLFFFLPIIIISCSANPVKKVITWEAIDVPLGVDSVPLSFRKIIVKLRRGEEIGQSAGGLLCVPGPKLKWRGGRVNITDEEFTEVFREELLKANYPIVGDPNALFDDPDLSKAELLVAGMITSLTINSCFPMSGYGNFESGNGGAYVKVDWQIYSLLDREVVYSTTTEGSFESESSQDLVFEVFTTAFSRATQNLLADKGFHNLIVRPKDFSEIQQFRTISIEQPKELEGNFDASYDRIQQSVVTVRRGQGHGSGFFIGKDGHIITNSHVVGKAKFVKIILATGREVMGEVLRTDKSRDLALIGTNERGRLGLYLSTKERNIGNEVYAAGSPIDESLQLSISKGIISAYRNEKGLRLIQSDVSVSPGNSGGPLIDNRGNVLGVAVSGMMPSGSQVGLNFFIPSSDIPKYLGLNIEGFSYRNEYSIVENKDTVDKKDLPNIPSESQNNKIEELQKEIERLKSLSEIRDIVSQEEEIKPKASVRSALDLTKSKEVLIREKLLKRVTPNYTSRMRSRGIEGSVLIKFDVNKNGNVENAFVLESSGHNELDLISLNAVKEFSYNPAILNGSPSATRGLKKRFTFNID